MGFWQNKEENAMEQQLKEKLDIYVEEDCGSWEIEEQLNDLKKFSKIVPDWLLRRHRFTQHCERIQKIIKERAKKEDKEQKEIDKRDDEETERLSKELFEFKKSKIHTSHDAVNALPLGKDYPHPVMVKAGEKMEKYAKVWLEAEEYYRNNDLDTKPGVFDFEASVYADYSRWKQGEENPPKEETETLDKDFYRAKDLDEETKNQLLNEGFEHSRGIELDGKICGGGFYFKKNDNESAYHFCMKNLFKELHRKMETEFEINGMRADVAYISENFKLAIEIETGNNNKHQLTAKAKWSEIHFDHCVFVCSRKNLNDYKKLLAGHSKIICLTAKKAKEEVEQLLDNYKV